MNTILRKCKSLSKLGRSSSYSSLRSKSTREDELWPEDGAAISADNGADEVAVFVGRSRRRYLVNSKHLNHPLLSALIDRSKLGEIRIKCEVVLFDHLLWMLENAELDVADDAATLEELAELYAC
ncbi:auxin-responsive protein SAUR76-like [Musa acuminata AAA Group]|uniref:auxin-responsive protein SAUR76-like n=1 Tax=Musa acuminata AAA Group TaxID=214697 RepID=UPI0031D7C9F1